MSAPHASRSRGRTRTAEVIQLDSRRRPAKSTTGGHHNKGLTFPPEPVTAEDIAALLAVCEPRKPGRSYELSALRLRALIVVLYRTGMRISEALALQDSDLDRDRQAITIRHGKGDKRRVVLMDPWGWAELDRWLTVRREIRTGAIFCVITGQTAGLPMAACDARRQFSAARTRAAVAHRCNPHSMRHGFSVEFYREVHDLLALQEQLGHSNLNVTGIYLRHADPLANIAAVGLRKPPMVVIPTPRS